MKNFLKRFGRDPIHPKDSLFWAEIPRRGFVAIVEAKTSIGTTIGFGATGRNYGMVVGTTATKSIKVFEKYFKFNFI